MECVCVWVCVCVGVNTRVFVCTHVYWLSKMDKRKNFKKSKSPFMVLDPKLEFILGEEDLPKEKIEKKTSEHVCNQSIHVPVKKLTFKWNHIWTYRKVLQFILPAL